MQEVGERVGKMGKDVGEKVGKMGMEAGAAAKEKGEELARIFIMWLIGLVVP